uniref:DUF5320 domain-containing protein n=1 Tax=Strongyloides venezuelensis TaxID=75913 RepID=A0A0K0FR33_STRVS
MTSDSSGSIKSGYIAPPPSPVQTSRHRNYGSVRNNMKSRFGRFFGQMFGRKHRRGVHRTFSGRSYRLR